MAIPHIIQKQIIKKRIKDLDGKTKINEIYKVLDELPQWNTGPYGELRKWLHDEIEKTATKSKIKHQDFFGVKKEGHKQFMLVGQPSVGKSSLVKKLCGLQTKIADYAFTTLKPIPGTVNINGAQIQLVDLPGLIQGASDDLGGGKRLLGLVKQTDGVILLVDATKPLKEADVILEELNQSNIKKPLIVVLNKVDRISNCEHLLKELKEKFPAKDIISVSSTTGEGLENLQKSIWKNSELMRIFPKDTSEPLILKKHATVKDYANKIHTNILKRVKTVRVTGKSVKFSNQQVGLNHKLMDEDEVELVLKN